MGIFVGRVVRARGASLVYLDMLGDGFMRSQRIGKPSTSEHQPRRFIQRLVQVSFPSAFAVETEIDPPVEGALFRATREDEPRARPSVVVQRGSSSAHQRSL